MSSPTVWTAVEILDRQGELEDKDIANVLCKVWLTELPQKKE